MTGDPEMYVGDIAEGVREALAIGDAGVLEEESPAPQTPTMAAASPCVIKVVGVGGGGGNTVNRMCGALAGQDTAIDFIALNTDMQALAVSQAETTLQLGSDMQGRGLGAGGNPKAGREAALRAERDIKPLVADTDLVFITAGMGGGTGSGAAPVVAELAKSAGALTVGIVTRPFKFEGRRRSVQAEAAIEELEKHVDILVVVSNDKLLQIVPDDLPLERSFAVADEILRQGITGISDIIVKPGLINVDFADVRAVMANAGPALMGIGTASGAGRAKQAAIAAISSPLLDFPIEKAKGLVFTISGSSSLSLAEVNDVAEVLGYVASDDANIIFGTSVDESLGDTISVTVVATSFDTDA